MKALVAMELQLRSDLHFFFAHCKTNGIQNEINRLFCASFVGYNMPGCEKP